MKKPKGILSPPTKAKGSKKDKAKEGDGNSNHKSDAKSDPIPKEESDSQQKLSAEGSKATVSRKRGSFRMSFRKKIKDVVRDLENKSQAETSSAGADGGMSSNQRRPAAEVALEAHSIWKKQAQKIPESDPVEENPLKMIKLKKVPPPEKKSSMDTKVKPDNLDGPHLSDYVFQTAVDDLDNEITPNQRRFGDVASEALAVSKQTASKIPESETIPIEETPLKMVKLKKVTPPEKKLTMDTKRKKFELPQLRSTKTNPKDSGNLPDTTPPKSEQNATESKPSASNAPIENQVTSLNKDSIQKDLTSTIAEENQDKLKIHEENIVEENKVELQPNKDSSLVAMEVEVVSSPQVQTAVSVSFTPVTMEMLDHPTVTNISESDEGIDSASDSVGEFVSASEGDDIVYEEPIQELLHGPEEYSRLGTRRISFNFSKNVVHNISQDESDDEEESDYEEEKEEKQEEKQKTRRRGKTRRSRTRRGVKCVTQPFECVSDRAAPR
ncbi:uncharacterized protein LOC134812327 [Bolinopsis microptera]|uniref:uncharacterized protein LOC134812327 n=1 Tax=Bolinopsis microptera TaxID=2820187 RepID=UPI0030790A9F